MFRVKVCVLLAPVVLLLAACGGSGSAQKAVPADAAAVVGSLTIPKSRIALLMNQARLNYNSQRHPFPKPGSSPFRGLRGRAVAYLVVGSMYEGKALDDGITASDAEVNAQVKREKLAYGKTPAAQAKGMERAAQTEQELRAEAKLRVLEGKVEAKLFKSVKVTDADVRRFYAANKARFVIPESRVIRQILVRTKALATKLMNMARSGSDFAYLAKKYSTDKPTAAVGGKVGITKGQTSPAFDKVAFSIPTGKVSNPIVTQYGWQILQAITPVKLAIVTPMSQVASDIRREVLQTRREHVLSKWQLAAKKDFCGGHKIAYATGYRPFTEDNPCNSSQNVTSAQPSTG